MSNEFYDDLSMSLNQALAIAKEEAKPSRKFSHEITDIKLTLTKKGLSQQQFVDKLSLSNTEKNYK